MKERSFKNLGNATAASVNAGTIGVQKDRVVFLDPINEIFYDPKANIRNGEVVNDSLEGLVSLRLTLDGAEQLQPIRVYPLPPDQLDPAKPQMKYGIAYGHRRTLCCRLTSADHAGIGKQPRKVAAVIDVEWLNHPSSYRLACQIHENTAKVDLNPVELGQALADYKAEFKKETGKTLSHGDLGQLFGHKDKTVYALLRAADFHQIAKDACHGKHLTDLDALLTLNQICTINEPMGEAIFASLRVDGAPKSRTILRQAQELAAKDGYVFSKAGWVWPDSVVEAKAISGMPENNQEQPPQSLHEALGVQQSSGDGQGGAGNLDNQGINTVKSVVPESQNLPAAETAQANTPSNPPNSSPAATAGANAKPSEAVAPIPPSPAPKGPILMVEFKMGTVADQVFTGELLLASQSKSTNLAVVAYLNEGGREETIEVPLNCITLVSLIHP
jgi:hypothetical protein